MSAAGLYGIRDDLDDSLVRMALQRGRRVWPTGMIGPFDAPVQVVEARGHYFVMVPDRRGPHVDSAHPTLRGAVRRARSLQRKDASGRHGEWYPLRDRRKRVKRRRARRRDPEHRLEILSVNRRHPNGIHYLVRVPTTKVKRGYDLVDVLFHDNGATSTKSANRLTSTAMIASRFAREHGPSYEPGRNRFGMHGRDPQVRPKATARTPFTVSITYDGVTRSGRDEEGYVFEDYPMTLGYTLGKIESYSPYDEVQELPEGGGRALLRLYGADSHTDRTGSERRYTLHIRGSERAIRRLARMAESRGGRARDRSRQRRRRRTR